MGLRERLDIAFSTIKQNNGRLDGQFKRFKPLYEECICLGEDYSEYHYAEYIKLLLWIKLSKMVGSKDINFLKEKARIEKIESKIKGEISFAYFDNSKVN